MRDTMTPGAGAPVDADGMGGSQPHEKSLRSSNELPLIDLPPKRGISPNRTSPAAANLGSASESISSQQHVIPSDYPSGSRMFAIMVALTLCIFLCALDNTIVATAIPSITDEFGGLQDAAWYGAAFFMTCGGFQPSWGKLFKYFPLKTVYMIAIFIFEIGSLVCAVAPSSVAFIIGRAVAGVGAAGIGAGSYTIIGFTAAPQQRATYTGLVGAVYGVGSVLGPLIGGAFSEGVTWRWCFYINLPVGALAFGIIIFFLHMPRSAKPKEAPLSEKLRQVDPLGATLLMGAMIAYLLALQYGGQTHPWSSSVVVGLIVGAVLIALAFGLWEYWLGERAIFVPRLFRQREIFLSAIYSTLLPGGFFSMVYYMPIYFQGVRGSSPVMSGVENLPFIIPAMIGALGSGLFISTTGLSTIVMVVGTCLGTIGCGLCSMFDEDTSTGMWVGFQIISGFGLGMAFQVPMIVGQATVDPADLASATSMLAAFQTIGGALCVAAAQAAFVNTLIIRVPELAPTVDHAQVVATGAGELRSVFPAEALPGLIASYLSGVRVTFYLEVALAGASLLAAACYPWKRLDIVAIKANGGAA